MCGPRWAWGSPRSDSSSSSRTPRTSRRVSTPWSWSTLPSSVCRPGSSACVRHLRTTGNRSCGLLGGTGVSCGSVADREAMMWRGDGERALEVDDPALAAGAQDRRSVGSPRGRQGRLRDAAWDRGRAGGSRDPRGCSARGKRRAVSQRRPGSVLKVATRARWESSGWLVASRRRSCRRGRGRPSSCSCRPTA